MRSRMQEKLGTVSVDSENLSTWEKKSNTSFMQILAGENEWSLPLSAVTYIEVYFAVRLQ